MSDKLQVARSFHETISHYQELRRVVHNFTEQQFSSFGIQMREITHADACTADGWRPEWPQRERAPDWEWTRLFQSYHSNTGIKRFDAALIKGGVLCGLCYGVPTRAKLLLKVHAIARKPSENPLEGSVVQLLLFAANAYARLLGCEEIWLVSPRNEKLVTVYERQGFTAARNRFGKPTHLFLRLNYGQN